jgi:hypothetical protein
MAPGDWMPKMEVGKFFLCVVLRGWRPDSNRILTAETGFPQIILKIEPETLARSRIPAVCPERCACVSLRRD